MRAGPFSNRKIIDLLNRYYVPVTSSNEEADDGGTAPPEERAARKRIYVDFYNKKLGIGDVHVYIVGPDGSSIGSLDNSGNDSEKMAARLMQIAEQLHTEPGPPAVKPHPQSAAPASPADSLILHLVSRSLAAGTWHEFPAENWIVLSRAEWGQLLPADAVALKSTWEVPRPLAVKLAEWVYPQNEERTQVNRSRVDVAAFRMTVVKLEGGVARARIDGKVRLKHSFYPNGQGEDYADSELLGFVDFDAAERRIQRLRIVTGKATYAGTDFRASLVSMSRETLDALGR